MKLQTETQWRHQQAIRGTTRTTDQTGDARRSTWQIRANMLGLIASVWKMLARPHCSAGLQDLVASAEEGTFVVNRVHSGRDTFERMSCDRHCAAKAETAQSLATQHADSSLHITDSGECLGSWLFGSLPLSLS